VNSCGTTGPQGANGWGSPKQPGLGQTPTRRQEPEKEAPDNWVAYFSGAQSREGMGASVLLVSHTGQHNKYVTQLAFPQKASLGEPHQHPSRS
jgi:hypothetical protein